jgi:hypothetical protein
MKTFQIRIVQTQEQWVEVRATDAIQAQQLALEQPITAEPVKKCYAVRLVDQ